MLVIDFLMLVLILLVFKLLYYSVLHQEGDYYLLRSHHSYFELEVMEVVRVRLIRLMIWRGTIIIIVIIIIVIW